ncbi:PAS domain S-box-containing protein [Methanofollis sp. W23]|uniref:PAS domain S-box protein n=1 Tax=Methanofollis sp. W23 TaxID=2817849 RepID=UPI001AEAAB6E|nr:PAS domain S-box protein [Methanofollis sp. W23]MBP2145608.1 PAS domain S-box-containing protein [Methanofollis sp. W23]
MIHLLLVDDEPAILEVGREFLEDQGGFCVDVAGSAEEAMACLRSHRYDAIVSDYEMPQTSGIAFLKAVRRLFPGMPFILFTGKGREEVVIEALNSGADFYLQKGGDPVSQFTELAHKVRQAVNRRWTERALRESEKNYRELVESLPNILFRADREGEITYLNKYGLAALEMSREEVIGQKWDLYLHPDDRQAAWERGSEMVRTGEPVINYETRVLRQRDREKAFPVLLTFTPLWDGDGQFVGLHGIAVDISEREKAQEALMEAETKYRVIAEGIYDGVTIGERDGTITFASPSMERIIGYTPEEMVGESYPSFVGGPDLERIQEHFRRTLEGEFFEGLHVRVVQKNGECADLEMNGGPVFDKEGGICGAQSIMRDVTRQRQAEQALRESEERLNVTLRSIGDGVVVTDEMGRVVMLNAVAEGMTGWIEKEALGHPLDEVFVIINEKTRRTAENPVTRVIETGRVVGLVNHTALIARDGSERLIADSAAPIRDRDGRIVGVVLVFRDVTTEKKAEAERLRLAAIVESSEDAIFGTDLEGVITSWNSAAETIYGYAPDEMIGRHVSMLAPEDRKSEFMAVVRRIRRGETTEHYESRRRRKDGREVEVSITISPMRDEDGSVTGFSAISRDITRRNEAVRALKESEETMNLVISGANLGVWDWNPSSGELLFNQIYEQMLRYDQGELERSDRLWDDLIHPEDYPRVQETLRAHIDGMIQYYHVEFRMRRGDGRWAWVRSQGKVVQRDEQGRALRMTGVHQDITEVRGYEEALKKANKKLNILNGVTRHDIVNQIVALQGYLYLIGRSAGADRALSGRVSSCMDLTDKIKRQILFTRDYENMGVKAPEWQGLEEVVRQAAGDLGVNGVALTVETGALEVFADPMLQKAVFNLFENSVRHGNEVSEIRVSFRESEEGGVLVIEDDGAGVPVEHKPQIFEAGFGKNTGYGLFLVREILDITGMTIAETGREGEGACFEIAVPEGLFRSRIGR